MKPYKGKIVGIIMSNKIAYFVFYFQNSIYCSFYYLISENTRKGKFLIELCHHRMFCIFSRITLKCFSLFVNTFAGINLISVSSASIAFSILKYSKIETHFPVFLQNSKL